MQRIRATRPAAAVALLLSLTGAGVATAKRAAPREPAPAPAPVASAAASATSSAAAPATSAPPAPSPRPETAPTAPVAIAPASSAAATTPAPTSSAEVDAPPPPPPPRAYGSPGEGADIPVKATRRRGFLVGLAGGLHLGSARGTPADFDLRNDANRVDTGVSPGYAGILFVGGALTDWFSFSLGIGSHQLTSSDLTFTSTAFLFRAEAYPLFGMGGRFRDVGIGLDLGTGSARVDRGSEPRAAAGGGSASIYGGSVFYDWLRASTFTAGPYLGYHHFNNETMSTDTTTLGLRVAFTTGP